MPENLFIFTYNTSSPRWEVPIQFMINDKYSLPHSHSINGLAAARSFREPLVWSRWGLAMRPSSGPTRGVRWLVGRFHTGTTSMAPVALMSTISWSGRIPPRARMLLRWSHVKAKNWKNTASRWCTMTISPLSYSSSFSHFSHTLRHNKISESDHVYFTQYWPLTVALRRLVKFLSS